MADKTGTYFSPDDRIIMLSDSINYATVGEVISYILTWNTDDEKKEAEDESFVALPIRLYVQSYGGSVYDAWGLIDAILTSRTPVYTYCFGTAMSAGLLIFLAGKKRFVSRHATLLYHQISLWNSGKFQDFVEDQEQFARLQKEIEAYVLSRSRFKKKQMKRIRKAKRDYYIQARDCIKLGLADEIIEEGKIDLKGKPAKKLNVKKDRKYMPLPVATKESA